MASLEGFDPGSLPPGFSAKPPGGAGGGSGASESKQAERDEQRQTMLTVMLTPAARERLNRVALVVSRSPPFNRFSYVHPDVQG